MRTKSAQPSPLCEGRGRSALLRRGLLGGRLLGRSLFSSSLRLRLGGLLRRLLFDDLGRGRGLRLLGGRLLRRLVLCRDCLLGRGLLGGLGLVVVVVVMVRAGREAFLALDRRFEFLARHFAVGDVGLVEQPVDYLVLVQRGAQLGGRHRLLLDILDEALAIFRAVLLCGLGDQAVHILLADLAAIGLADLRQEQAKTHAALGDRLIIVALGFHFLQRRFRIRLVRRFVLQLLPDLRELGVDHRRRHREVMTLGQLVEQLALHVRAGQAVELLLYLALEQALQLLEVGQAQRGRQVVVDLALARGLHRLDDEVEGRRLARQFLGLVILREGDVDLLLVAGLHADHLVLETRDQATRADLDRHVGAGATIERHAVDLADEVHHDEVAGLGLVGRLGVVPALLLVGELLQLLVDRAVVGRHRQALELQCLDRRSRHVGQDFQLDLHFGILAELVTVIEADRGLDRRADLLVGDQLLDAFLDRAVERILHQRRAVHLAHQVRRDLAGAEAGHAHLRRDLLQLGIAALVDILGGDLQRVATLQAFVQRLDSLHDLARSLENNGVAMSRLARRDWCGRRDSNPHILRYWNLNPARLPVPPRPHGTPPVAALSSSDARGGKRRRFARPCLRLAPPPRQWLAGAGALASSTILSRSYDKTPR